MRPVASEFPFEIVVPSPLSISFEGFGTEAFDTLRAIKASPRIETYRELKPEIKSSIIEPFKRYRDDLVVNWVLPNMLPFETERNVFSRLLKNDFGAGGCHHHLWLSFYRPGMRRLTDLQLAHTIRDTGFSVSLFIGDNAPKLFTKIKNRLPQSASVFIERTNALLRTGDWAFRIRPGKAARGEFVEHKSILLDFPEEIIRSKGMWWSIFFPFESILDDGKQLVDLSLRAIQALWPLYLFLLNEPPRLD